MQRHRVLVTTAVIAAAIILMVNRTTAEEGKSMNPENPQVIMKTSMGEIRLELNKEKAPITVENFLQYMKSAHYDDTIFHRVIPNFMIQGGGFTSDMQQKTTGDQIRNEAANGLKNDNGTIAMARTSDVNSATAQFFINVKDNDFLNHTNNSPQGYGYAVFGKVVQGSEVLEKIAAVSTGMKAGHQDVPNEPIIIERIELVEAK